MRVLSEDTNPQRDTRLYICTAGAAEALGKAAALAPDFIDIQINFARVLVANNKEKKAEAVLSNILPKATSFDQRKKIEDELGNI